MKYLAAFCLAAALPAAHAVAFGGPAPTDTSPNKAFDGMTPKPTNGPTINELRKRQSNLSPEICGWVDGQFGSAVSCTIGTCMLYKSASVNLAGCCTGSDRLNCGWASSCIDLSGYAAGGCGSNCRADSLVRKCTNVLAPYCVTWTYPADGVSDYGCASDSGLFVSTIRSTASGLDTTTSIRLPTVAANALAAPTTSIYGGSGGSGGGYSGGSSYTRPKTKKKLAISSIIGIVVAALALLFFAAIAVFMLIKKKKKNKQIADNAQLVASAQANRPQSQFPPPQGPPPPMSPAPSNTGYFAPPPQQNMHEQKHNPHASVTEYAMTPVSGPTTPAPQYSQPYGTPGQAPPMPQQYQYVVNGAHEVAAPVPPQSVSPVPQQQSVSPMQPNADRSLGASGAHEVDAVSAPHAQGKTGPVYEMGGR